MKLLIKQREQTIVYLILGLAIVAYSIYFSLYQVDLYRAQWAGIDTTNMEQTIWNTLNGNFMRATTYPSSGRIVENFTDRLTESRLADHVQPLQLFLLIPYALLPRIETLTTIMSIAVALGALPLFEIARRRLQSVWLALGFALVYLLLPGIQTNTGWEIHGTHFLPPLMLAALNAAEKNKRGWAWVWALLAMGCREDIPFLMGWAFFWLAPQTFRRDKQIMLGLGLTLSLLNFLVIIPAFSGGLGTPYLVRFFPPQTEMSLPGILAVIGDASYWSQQFGHFLAYVAQLGLPVLFLCFLHGRSVAAMLPLLFLNGFAWEQTARLPFFSHYSSPIIVWTIVGAIYGVSILSGKLKQKKPLIHWRELATAAILTAVIAISAILGYLPYSQSFAWPAPIRSQETLTQVFKHIPADAAVSAGLHLAPHLAQRETIRIFPDIREVDWIVIDLWFWGDPYGVGLQVWDEIATHAEWQTVTQHDGLILLTKGNGPPQKAFSALQLVHEQPAQTMHITFENSEQQAVLYNAQIFPLPYNLLILCTDWQFIGTASNVQIAVGNEPWQSLRSFYLAQTDISAQTEIMRDCTQLLAPDNNLMLDVRLRAKDKNDNILIISRIEPSQWLGELTSTDDYLQLKIPVR